VRVVFLGTPRAASPALTALLDAGHQVRLVVTQPDRPAGRSRVPEPPPIKQLALSRGLAVAQPDRVRGEPFTRLVADREPDVLVVVAYGRLLPRAVIELPPHGTVNAHFSLLPRYRGAAPVQWALAHGETRTGVSTMRVVEQLDAGPVLLQQEVAIEPGEHAPALEARLAAVAGALLVDTLEGLRAGTLEPRAQDERQATIAPRLTRADGEIDFTLTAQEIEGRVRGFDPWPGVWARAAGRRLRLVEARSIEVPSSEPAGTVAELWHGEGLRVACARGTSLVLTAIQFEGARRMTARDAVNGRVLGPGSVLDGGTATV
jgi:methionyl-tRNA formyltransferase